MATATFTINDDDTYVDPGGESWTGSTESETHAGTAGDDYLNGNGGNDSLYGYDGNDSLVDGSGGSLFGWFWQ